MSDEKRETIKTLPTDDMRAIMWRYADRYDLQMLVQAARSVARGPVAKLVAEGARNTHEWTEGKASLLKAFDESGITSLFMDPKHGGYMEGPKNFALALAAFELSWVDGGSATCSLAGNLALEPIKERGTEEQKDAYMAGAVPGRTEKQFRGAFVLTESLPYVGVETGILSGKVRVADFSAGHEPILQVEKRGRFITNMDFANFVCAAVASDDPRIKGSCMVIVEESDQGVFDRGSPTLKLVHQLSSTRDPIINMKVPASRIIGGYTIKDGVIVPNYNHGEIIEAVFKRTRVTVGLMTAAKLISAVEPVIRYQRGRFRGGDVDPSSPRHKLGIQQKEDALNRLTAIWAMGEASAALGFEAARVFDELDPLEKEKDAYLRSLGIERGRAELKAITAAQKEALELLELERKGVNNTRCEELKNNPLVRYVITDALANVLCPACKLWNTGYGANLMREAVALMGGYGITEDCPGFLGQKWMDCQLEATYEGPEVVQRRQLSMTMGNEVFLRKIDDYIAELEKIHKDKPLMGAGAISEAMKLWKLALTTVEKSKDSLGQKLSTSSRHGASYPLTDAICWLLASRQQIVDTVELEKNGGTNPAVAEGLDGTVNFFSDLAFVQAGKAAGEIIKTVDELFYGYGINDSQTEKALMTQKARVEERMKGFKLAFDRTANALISVMIPEALDYPAM